MGRVEAGKSEAVSLVQLSSCSEMLRTDSMAFRERRIRTNPRFLARSEEPFIESGSLREELVCR